MKRQLCFSLAIAVCLPCLAQEPTTPDYPRKGEITILVEDTQSLLNRFEEQSGKVTFGLWTQPYIITKLREEAIQKLRKNIRNSKEYILLTKASKRVSGAELFVLHLMVRDVETQSESLVGDVRTYEENSDLSLEFARMFGTASAIVRKLDEVLLDQLLAERHELKSCRGQPTQD